MLQMTTYKCQPQKQLTKQTKPASNCISNHIVNQSHPPPKRPEKYKLISSPPLPPLPACKTAIFARGAVVTPVPGNTQKHVSKPSGHANSAWVRQHTRILGPPGSVEEIRVEAHYLEREGVFKVVEASIKGHSYEEVAMRFIR